MPWRRRPRPAFRKSGRAGINATCLVYETRRLCFEGSWQKGGPWSAKVSTESFPLEALAKQAPGKPGYRGILVADARASGKPGEPWIADLRAEIRDAALSYKSTSGADRTVELGLTRLTLASDAKRHRLDMRMSDAADIDFTVALEAERVADRPFRNFRSSGTVKGSTRLIGLLPLLVDAIDVPQARSRSTSRLPCAIGAPLLGVRRR